MKRNRAIFKLALRCCRNRTEEMKADACAESLLNKMPASSGMVSRLVILRHLAHVNSISGVTGSVDATRMWKNYFEKL